MDFSGRHYPKDLILQTVRWYLRYSLSYRDMEEILEERGVEINHTTPYRWVQEYAPQLEAEHRKRRKVCGTSWRMDETYIKVKGEWVYLYRAVDTEGDTVDFLLTKKRDKKAATRFFKKAIKVLLKNEWVVVYIHPPNPPCFDLPEAFFRLHSASLPPGILNLLNST